MVLLKDHGSWDAKLYLCVCIIRSFERSYYLYVHGQSSNVCLTLCVKAKMRLRNVVKHSSKYTASPLNQFEFLIKIHVNITLATSGVPRNFVRGGQQIQLRTVDRENGDLGAVAP